MQKTLSLKPPIQGALKGCREKTENEFNPLKHALKGYGMNDSAHLNETRNQDVELPDEDLSEDKRLNKLLNSVLKEVKL